MSLNLEFSLYFNLPDAIGKSQNGSSFGMANIDMPNDKKREPRRACDVNHEVEQNRLTGC